jgi:hypothetical protein
MKGNSGLKRAMRRHSKAMMTKDMRVAYSLFVVAASQIALFAMSIMPPRMP